jgi:hypothetical protein
MTSAFAEVGETAGRAGGEREGIHLPERRIVYDMHIRWHRIEIGEYTGKGLMNLHGQTMLTILGHIQRTGLTIKTIDAGKMEI